MTPWHWISDARPDYGPAPDWSIAEERTTPAGLFLLTAHPDETEPRSPTAFYDASTHHVLTCVGSCFDACTERERKCIGCWPDPKEPG